MTCHGDVPLGYREKEKETHEPVHAMMRMASEKIKAVPIEAMDDLNCGFSDFFKQKTGKGRFGRKSLDI